MFTEFHFSKLLIVARNPIHNCVFIIMNLHDDFVHYAISSRRGLSKVYAQKFIMNRMAYWGYTSEIVSVACKAFMQIRQLKKIKILGSKFHTSINA